MGNLTFTIGEPHSSIAYTLCTEVRAFHTLRIVVKDGFSSEALTWIGNTESSGSFVREPKLLATARGGVTLLQAIQARYQDRQPTTTAPLLPIVNGTGRLPNGTAADGASDQAMLRGDMPSGNGASSDGDDFPAAAAVFSAMIE